MLLLKTKLKSNTNSAEIYCLLFKLICYCTNYFQNSLNDLKSTWKGIRRLTSLKELPSIAPSNICDNCRSLTEPQEIANACNKYFVNVTTGTQKQPPEVFCQKRCS